MYIVYFSAMIHVMFKKSVMCFYKVRAYSTDTRFKGAVSRNSAKLGNCKIPVNLRET